MFDYVIRVENKGDGHHVFVYPLDERPLEYLGEYVRERLNVFTFYEVRKDFLLKARRDGFKFIGTGLDNSGGGL